MGITHSDSVDLEITKPAPSPCIVCGMELDYAANDEAFYTVPHAGTQFTTVGHYGSTVYDPNVTDIDEWLEVNICDACLTARAERVVRCKPVRVHYPKPTIREPWMSPASAPKKTYSANTEPESTKLKAG